MSNLHTSATCFVAELRAVVSVSADCLRARLATLVVDVISVVRVTDPLTRVTTAQPIPTLAHAATFRRLVEVFRCPRLDLCFLRVVLTGQAKRFAYAAILFSFLYNLTPQFAISGEVSEVADDVEAHLGARQRHADSVFILHESNARLDFAAAAAAND